jgi:hypothetical protein
MPTHGFGPGWLGRRMRSLGRGGRRGGASLVLLPLGGMVGRFREKEGGQGESIVMGGRGVGWEDFWTYGLDFDI